MRKDSYCEKNKDGSISFFEVSTFSAQEVSRDPAIEETLEARCKMMNDRRDEVERVVEQNEKAVQEVKSFNAWKAKNRPGLAG